MSTKIRNTFDLLTLRISLTVTREDAKVVFDLYRGREQVGEPFSVEASYLGIPTRIERRSMSYQDMDLPGDVLDKLTDKVTAAREADEVVWLQLSRGSVHLSLIPWERIFVEAFDSPVLRIPNFAVDPHLLEGPLELAICASSPAAKSPFYVPDYVNDLVRTVQESATQGSTIHVFVDQQFCHDLDFAPHGPEHEIIVHNPEEAAEFGQAETERTLPQRRSTLLSPWLCWMEAKLRGRVVDAAHFVCPGYFSRELGSLALAHSPLENVDQRWSHFIAASELNTFLNRLGIWSTAITVPYGSDWNLGLRILAEQLARVRPEPILLHEAEIADDGMARAYGFLYGPGQHEAPRALSVSLYAHPKRVHTAEAEDLAFHSIAQSEFQSHIAAEPIEDFEPLLYKSSSSDTGRRRPQWQAAMKLDVEQSFARLTEMGIESESEQGKAEALMFVAELISGEGDGGVL